MFIAISAPVPYRSPSSSPQARQPRTHSHRQSTPPASMGARTASGMLTTVSTKGKATGKGGRIRFCPKYATK